jgi:hypothetical protein
MFDLNLEVESSAPLYGGVHLIGMIRGEENEASLLVVKLLKSRQHRRGGECSDRAHLVAGVRGL